MKTRILLLSLMLLFGAVFLFSSARAAEFSPTLEAQLAQKAGSDFMSAIVILQSPLDIQALDAKLHAERAGKVRRHKEVLDALHYNADITQPQFKAELDQAKRAGVLQGYTAYWIENLFVIYAQKDFITTFRPRGDIKAVTENFQAETIQPIRTPDNEDSQRGRNPLDSRTVASGIQAVGALRVNEELGITGAGVIVGNMDTGVDGTHPALAARWRGAGGARPWQECWRDALHTTSFPTANGTHGTHTMGTMCGRGVSGTDTTWVGCAPNAKWIADRAVDQGQSNTQFVNDVIDGFQWFADPDTITHSAAAVPDVVQNSWGIRGTFGAPFTECFDQWNTVVLNCEAAGVVVTWSAGNEGSSGLRAPAIWSLSETDIFSVGAVDATGYPTTPYPIASFSSLGPSTCTPAVPNNIKPEISAPGVNVLSTVPGGTYESTNWSGTSMAGPHVAGVVALMREACPDCDPTTIKMAIINTAIRTGYVTPPATENNTFGNGFIDGYAAVRAVSNLGRVGGVVRDASSAPLAGVTVKNAAGAQSVLTNASGQYYLPLAAATYTIQYSKFGYISQSVPGIVIVTGDTTIQNITLQSAPTGTVSGTVTSCFGGPAVGATVEVLNTPVSPATTNGSGFYSITLPQGTYDLKASGAGCGAQTVTGLVIGTTATQNFTLPSDPRYSCSPMDAYGYTACENVDPSGPVYSWRAVAASEGGSGTTLSLTDDSYSGPTALPFPVKFYGTTYTNYYVGSNGFVTFSGGSSTTSGCMPDATQPVGIYAMWNDLNPATGGQVATYYDAANHLFVVEFYHINHYGTTTAETFETIIYDPAYYPTATGDANIVLQYNVAASVAACGVGIQSSATNYINYLCNGTLPANTTGLVAGRAIRFSTGAACVGAPDIALNAAGMTGAAPLNGTDVDSIQVCNAGPCPLFWSASWSQTTPVMLLASPSVVSMTKAEAEAGQAMGDKPAAGEVDRQGRDMLDSHGGPDSYGYHWTDSNDPGGPIYNWVELASIGTALSFTSDDQVLPVTLPWSFPFYGSSYTTANVSADGNIHFGTLTSAYANAVIPSSAPPNALLAAFWDDLSPQLTGAHVWTYNDVANSRYIVQWDSVNHYSTLTGNYTFEIILQSNGQILYQYQRLTGALNSCTVGIENATGTVGLQVVYNAVYLANSLAIRFSSSPIWLTLGTPTSGTLNSGQCSYLRTNFSAQNLATGTYTGNLVFTSNDPDENPTNVPVTFLVGQLNVPTNLTIRYIPETDQLQFNWTSAGAPQYKLYSATTPDGPFTTFVGQTAATTFSIANPGNVRLCYIVVSSN